MNLRRRATTSERLDAPGIPPATLAPILADLAQVNAVTLARPPTLAFLRRAAHGREHLSILDVGFGHGDMLRRIARWARHTGRAVTLEGIDLQPASAAIAEAATPSDLAITYRTGDVFEGPSASVDVILSSLVAHHMSDAELVRFLSWMERTARVGWFINDLHRHQLAYHGFRALAAVALWHDTVAHDGAISVTRGFRRDDWTRLLAEAGVPARVTWHLPFRWGVSRLK